MKYFTKEVKIALTAIVAGILIFFGINFFKGVNLFRPSNMYVVLFDNVAGLTVSSPVYASGYPVGTVRTIQYDYARGNRVAVEVEVDEKMRLPRGTRAELIAEMLGGVTMSFVMGPDPADALAPGDTLPGGLHQGALEKLEALAPTLEKLGPKLDSILTNVNRLTSDPALARTLHNTAQLTAELSTTSRNLNALMSHDIPELTGKLNRIGSHVETLTGQLAASDVQGTVEQVRATLERTQSLMTSLTGVTQTLHSQMTNPNSSLGLLMNDRQLYDNLNSTVRSADSLLIDLRQHPKRYVHFSLFGRKDK